jgi:hypothetical protein
MEVGRTRCVRFALVLALSLLLTSCASTSQNPNQPVPSSPTDILNGSSFATADSHWVAQACNVKVELTADGDAWTVVVDTSGTTSSGPEKWTAGPSPGSIEIGPGTGLVNFFWVSALTNIRGSTSSKTFSANVTVEQGTGTTQSLGECSFVLQSGNLPD